MSIKILVGPLSWVGGVRSHIENIKKFSLHEIKLLEYSKYSLYYPTYKLSRLLNEYKYSYLDLYAIYLKNIVLPQYDVLHTHGHTVWGSLYKSRADQKLKCIHTVHQIYFRDEVANDDEWNVLDFQNKLMFNYCQNPNVTTVTVSEFVRNILLDYNINAEVIPNGIDFEEIQKGNPNRFRTEYKIEDDFYLFIGHMGFIKRPDLFIELAKKIPDKKFVMIGSDITRENIFLKYNIDIPENLIIIGKVPRGTVVDALKACRVLVHPSIRENFSITLLESLACGKTTVASNSGGIPELNKYGASLILFEPNDFDDLFEKANYAWDHPELGNQGYRTVKEKYDWKIIIKSVDQLYERVMQ